jgi:dolichol-phosphate mannosyltransferase
LKTPFLLSVVIPCFNEEEVIGKTYAALQEKLGGNKEFSLELVFIDDGSTDNTVKILNEFAAQDPGVKIIELSRNFGHQVAVTAGLDFATGDAVAIIDADLQDPPEVILTMIERWKEGNNVIFGVRRSRPENQLKQFGYNTFYKIYQKLAYIDVAMNSGDFCLLDKKAVIALASLPEKSRFVRGLRSWIGLKQIGVPYDRHPRAGGKSKYSLYRLIVLAYDGIFNFSSKPIMMISIAGLILASVSILLGILILIWRIVDIKILGASPSDVSGWTTIILFLLFFNGVNLFSLGIIGEYVARMYQEVKNRPIYVIQKKTGFPLVDKNSVEVDEITAQSERFSGRHLDLS